VIYTMSTRTVLTIPFVVEEEEAVVFAGIWDYSDSEMQLMITLDDPKTSEYLSWS